MAEPEPVPDLRGASPEARRRALLAFAQEIGFDRVGIAPAAPLPSEAARFRDWLDRGLHGRMTYLESGADARLHPERLLRDVRTVVVGAVRYGPQAAPRASPLSGEVAGYAWGEDYHRHVGERAARLASFVRRAFDARAAEWVDTGPLLERMWAARAGIGWIGRNALVLDRDLGSYLLLGVVLTDAALPTDEAAVDQCGACALCVEACPTGAIVEPRVVDSRRCLSYHTIELRGAFPEEHREMLGTRVFGCDACQEVCPWNRDAAAPSEAFLPRADQARPDLADLLTMSMATYTDRFRGTSMKRATYQGLRRNAAIALGNLLAGRATPDDRREPPSPADRARAAAALRTAAEDSDPFVRDAARWALRVPGASA